MAMAHTEVHQMEDDRVDTKRLSRRDLLRRAGLSSAGLIAAGAVGPLSAPAFASSAQNDSPEGFLAYALRQASPSNEQRRYGTP